MISQSKTLKDKISEIINYYNIGEFNKVIKESTELLTKNPTMDFLWNILGLSQQNLAYYKKAEKNFLKALQINPKNLSAFNNLGNNYKYLEILTKLKNIF